MSLVNMYFQQMIKITSSCGGDVIKFAGDALIVLWTQGSRDVQAHRACECAMELQDALHDCPMTRTIRLSLKVGVGVGSVTMFYVGGHEGRCEYFASGSALRECFNTADAAASGDVIVSGNVWEEVQGESEGRPIANGFHSLLSMRQTFRKRSVQRSMAFSSELPYTSLRRYAPPVLLSAHALEATLGQSLRAWTVSVVQASIVFINLGIGGLMDQLALDCHKIHEAVVTVQRTVHALQGCIHRFTVDDKGCVMKVVFGAHIPHEDQPYRALLAALQLRQALSMQGIQPSIGVASGESLIGPVGSAVRQEFTVHGATIILAARLMQLATKYGGMVLCDEQTHASTCDELRFVALQPVELKGKKTTVNPYRPVASSELLEKPTLTAKPDGQYYCEIEAAIRARDDCAKWLKDPKGAFRAVIVTGGHGAGKTQLVMQIRKKAEESCCVLHVRCRAHEAVQRGALLRRLFAQLCRHDVWPSLQHITPMLAPAEGGAEETLVAYELQLLRSHATAYGRPAIDGRTPESSRADARQEASEVAAVPGVAATPTFSSVNNDRPETPPPAHELRAAVPSEHGASSRSNRLVIIIDDVHHADAHSCEVLRQLARSAPEQQLLVLTCREPCVSLGNGSVDGTAKNSDEANFSAGHRLVHALASMRDNITPLNLRPVASAGCEALACAALEVAAIPAVATSLVVQRSGGSPQLCQAIAGNLLRRGVLQIEDGKCRLSSLSTERHLNAAATEALKTARHSVLCVKIAGLSMLQQLVLKTMSLLPQSCPQALLAHAIPIHIDMSMLTAQLRALRERNLIAVPQSHRRSVPSVLASTREESTYNFVDVGMREVCQHLMVESQKRQIRLKVVAANESNKVLGSLADSITSSLSDNDELRRSLSPSMLRASRLRSSGISQECVDGNTSSGTTAGESGYGPSSFEGDPQWWLARPTGMLSSPSSRLVQRTNKGHRSPSSMKSSPLSQATWSGRQERLRPLSQLSSSFSRSFSTPFASPLNTSKSWRSHSPGRVMTSAIGKGSPYAQKRGSSAKGNGLSEQATHRKPTGKPHGKLMSTRIRNTIFKLLRPGRRLSAPVIPVPDAPGRLACTSNEDSTSYSHCGKLVAADLESLKSSRGGGFSTPDHRVTNRLREPSPPLGDGPATMPLALLPPAVTQLSANDKSLDGRLAELKHVDEGLTTLVGSRRTQRPTAARCLFG